MEGTVLAERYVLGRLLGRGGMADVYEATDQLLSRPVAVKLLRETSTDPAERERFAAEGRTLARLNHPNLVTVLDVGTDAQQRPFLVLELVVGESLAELLPRRMAAPRVALMGAQVAEALAHVHEHGVVHRDVKPANILLGSDGRARLTDFGIARLLADTLRHTRTGLAIGTVAYLSPEQVRGQPVAPPSDVYSLGLVLLEALTGEQVYPGVAAESALARVHAPPPLPADLAEPWRELLRAMTGLDPALRPSAEHVASVLHRLARDEDETQHLTPAGTRVFATSGPVVPPAVPRGEATMTLQHPGSGLVGLVRRSRVVLLAVAGLVCIVVLGLAIEPLLGGARDPGSSDLPDDVPAPVREPLRQLHDAVGGER